MSIVIFSLVAAVVVYSVWKWRVPADDDSDGPPIYGNTGLEIVWTAIPALIVIVLGIVSAFVLSENGQAGPNPLQVTVIGQQFTWKSEYPEQGGVKSGELVIPVGRETKFTMQSVDVIHSFWVPNFGQKMDAVAAFVEEAKLQSCLLQEKLDEQRFSNATGALFREGYPQMDARKTLGDCLFAANGPRAPAVGSAELDYAMTEKTKKKKGSHAKVCVCACSLCACTIDVSSRFISVRHPGTQTLARSRPRPKRPRRAETTPRTPTMRRRKRRARRRRARSEPARKHERGLTLCLFCRSCQQRRLLPQARPRPSCLSRLFSSRPRSVC
jgi:hypothetical protein